MVLSSGKRAYHPPNPFIPTPSGFTPPKDHKPSLRSKTILPWQSENIRRLDIARGVQHYNVRIIFEYKWSKKCFLGLSSLWLFIAWKAVGGLGDWEWKLAYIRRHTKQQHERRRSEEQQQGGFYCFCQPTPFKPNSNHLKPQSNNLKPHQTPKLFPILIVIPNIFCNFAHGITIQ